jgi:hypothetical protein
LDWWSDALNNVAAFGAGALNELTGGLSGAILSATVPGYDCFVKDHRDWYDAGTVVAVVTEIVVAVATVVVSAGTAAAAVIGVAVVKAALRQSAKGAAKAIEHGVENTVAHQAERSLVASATKGATKKYEVGTYQDLRSRSRVGDGLDIHHVPQTQPASQVISGYSRKSAPSIALPQEEHQLIPNLKGPYTGTASELVGRDLKNLRDYTNAPASALAALKDLISRTFSGQL